MHLYVINAEIRNLAKIHTSYYNQLYAIYGRNTCKLYALSCAKICNLYVQFILKYAEICNILIYTYIWTILSLLMANTIFSSYI